MQKRRTALITGGTSGIGLAISKQLLLDGYDIIVHFNTSVAGKHEILTLSKRLDKSVRFIQADFSQVKSVGAIAQFVNKQKMGLHAIIHCAGANEKKDFTLVTRKDFNKIFSINLATPFFLTQKLIPLLSKDSSIVFIGSSYAFVGGGKSNVLYSTSKSALLGFTKNLSKILAPDIRVNAVIPGYIESKMLREKASSDYLMTKKKQIPAKEFGMPSNIADMVAFIISPKASYITGQAIHVNGGLFLS